MTPLFMISLSVDLRALRQLCARNGFDDDEGRGLHHFLAETFGKSVIQPFRLMPGRNGARLASLYGYSARSKQQLQQAARETGLPEMAGLFGLDQLATKPMPENWSEGRRLAFDVRIRPVRRLLKPLEAVTRESRRATLKGKSVGPIGKGAEIDAFLVERLRRFPDGMSDADKAGATREEVYRAWLAERLKGARLDPLATRMVACERVRALRGSCHPEACDVVFHGEMTITEPPAFQEMLEDGIGRHKAYGYGMMLLRPTRV